MNWHEACLQLQGLIPPEVTHYQHNQHAGMGWYLHTVIPSDPEHVIHKTWLHLQSAHVDLISLMPQAYDWCGHLIPDAHSVWLLSPHYVHVTDLWPTSACEIWNMDQAMHYWAEQIDLWAQPNNLTDAPIHKLSHVTNFMHTYTSAAQAAHRRTKFRVIKHDEKDSGSAHSRSNMDPV